MANKTYKHSDYYSFYVKDPKLRHIHKACVKDRVLHHAIFRILYPIFDKTFIFDSYSCRIGKGTHRAVNRFEEFGRKVNRNNSRNCFALKCDIKKFFDSIDHKILGDILGRKIKDENTVWLVEEIIKSFSKVLPLGNITSQLFANIYLNEFDKFIKYNLKIKYYIRYCDDFVILDKDRTHLGKLIQKIDVFLQGNLKLHLHPSKTIIRKYRQGIDFLGYVRFPNYRILRITTKNRAYRKIKEKFKQMKNGFIGREKFMQSVNSYLGLLSHCNGFLVKEEIFKIIQS